MVHKTLCVMLTLMSVLVTVVAQDRHDDQAVQERAIRLEPFIVAAARRYGIDARILRAICFVESRYRIDAVSPKGARGPMQFMPETAARYGLRDPHDREQAIDAAARYSRDLLKRFDGRIDLALAAYNAGEGAVSSFRTGKPLVLRNGKIVNARGAVTGGIPPYAETQRYVRSVLTLLIGRAPIQMEKSTEWVQFDSRRDRTLDSFDVPARGQKLSRARRASFIEVQCQCPGL